MKTILLVDDSRVLVEMYGAALRHCGYHVIEAETGEAALALARQHLPDLIITDIEMPGGDGPTLLRAIRHDPELRAKQVVLMTGRPDLVTPRAGMEEGADDFLLKPVNLATLQKCVEARFRRAAVSWRVEDQMLAQLRSSIPPQLPHEFFTPMAGIIGLLEILRAGSRTMSPEEIRGIHDDLYESACGLNRTLRNYLLILDLQNAAPHTDLKQLSWPDVEKSIFAGVEEALVDNACKFSRHGTPVTVELSADGRLTITDRGRGLTADQIGRIGAFQQFDRKKFEQQGLGLGLVLVQKLSAMSGAKFHITSQPTESTQVEVKFVC